MKRKEVKDGITRICLQKFDKETADVYKSKLNKRDLANMRSISHHKIDTRYGSMYNNTKTSKADCIVLLSLLILSFILVQNVVYSILAFIVCGLAYFFFRTDGHKSLTHDALRTFVHGSRVKVHYKPKFGDYKLIAIASDEDGYLNVFDINDVPKGKDFGKYKVYIADKENLSTMVHKHIKNDDFDVESMSELITKDLKNYYYGIVNNHESLSKYRDTTESNSF